MYIGGWAVCIVVLYIQTDPWMKFKYKALDIILDPIKHETTIASTPTVE